MPNRKLVQCQVGRAGSGDGSLRYIPIELFGMWKYLMSHRHHFEVRSPVPSLWVEMDQAATIPDSDTHIERVTELRIFVYSKDHGMLTEIRRYLPTAELEEIRPLLLQHYSSSQTVGVQKERWRERPGAWFRPNREQRPTTDRSLDPLAT